MRKLYVLLRRLLLLIEASVVGSGEARAERRVTDVQRDGSQGELNDVGVSTHLPEAAGEFVVNEHENLRDESESLEMTRKQEPPEKLEQSQRQEQTDRHLGSKRFDWVKERLMQLEEQNHKLFKDTQNLTQHVIQHSREIDYLKSTNSDLNYSRQRLADDLKSVQAQIREIREQVAELVDSETTLRNGAADLTRRLAAVEQSVKDLRDEHVAEKLSTSGSLSVAGSDGQPRLIADKLKELRTQNTRRVVNSILSYMDIDGDRRANSAWVGNILSHEIYIKSQDQHRGEADGEELSEETVKITGREILKRLGFAGEMDLPTELFKELEQLITEGLGLTYKALKAKPVGTLWLEPEGTPLDTDKHEVMAGCPDTAATSQIQFTSHPGYKVNDVIYVKALVYTKDSH